MWPGWEKVGRSIGLPCGGLMLGPHGLPQRRHPVDAVGMLAGQIACFGPILAQVVQFPWAPLARRDEFPVSVPQSAILLVFPPQHPIVRHRRVSDQIAPRCYRRSQQRQE
ncbi:MAG: hypothetical protein ACK56I_12815, partial [bacterium]